MSEQTETIERTPVTTDQLNAIHAALVERIGHGIDPAKVRLAMEDAGYEWLHKVDEPQNLLAVVQDRAGRRYFRWAYSTHTFAPWRALGAVHADTDENYRWADMTGVLTPVRVEFPGLPVHP